MDEYKLVCDLKVMFLRFGVKILPGDDSLTDWTGLLTDRGCF